MVNIDERYGQLMCLLMSPGVACRGSHPLGTQHLVVKLTTGQVAIVRQHTDYQAAAAAAALFFFIWLYWLY